MSQEAQQVARANAHRPSFFVHDSRARNSVLALGERGSSLTFGKEDPMDLPDAETMAKRVIAGFGSHENLVAVFRRQQEEFAALWNHDAERIGRVLKAHLTVEYYLTRYLEQCSPKLAPVSDVRLTFSQKVELLHPRDGMAGQLKPGLKRLNQIRNRLAHNLRVDVNAEDAKAFLEVVMFHAMRKVSAERSGTVPSSDPLLVFEEFAKFAVSAFQGTPEERAIWANAARPADETKEPNQTPEPTAPSGRGSS